MVEIQKVEIQKVDIQKTASDYVTLGNTLLQQRNVLQAIECYQRAIQIEPNLSETYHNLGEAFTQLEQWNQAISSYQKALELNPTLAVTYQRLGSILAKVQQWQEAVLAYQKSFEIQPDSFIVCHKIAQILVQQGQIEQAINYYLIAIKLQPFFQWSYWNLWSLLAQNHRLQEAVDLYQAALETYPNSSMVELNLGDVLTRQGKLQQAIACYQRSSYKKFEQLDSEMVKNYWDDTQNLTPRFIIIGVQKGGTTSLYRYLSEHPQVAPAIKKEIYFWNHHYKRGMEWYLSHFPKLKTDQRLFMSGEASPNYFEDATVAARISETFPEMKLILLLRNPVDRAVSQYYHWVRLGWEQTALEAAMDAEIEMLGLYPKSAVDDDNYWNLSSKYLWRGIYVVFLKQWRAVFPKEQFLILKSDDFYSKPQVVLKQVFEFLGLPDYDLSEYPQYNQGFYQSMPDSVRNQLTTYFKSHNQDLEDFLGLNLNWD
ncbi:MAG: tetratricopeptide repeat protein [Microcoleaceae cyanobacterium]